MLTELGMPTPSNECRAAMRENAANLDRNEDFDQKLAEVIRLETEKEEAGEGSSGSRTRAVGIAAVGTKMAIKAGVKLLPKLFGMLFKEINRPQKSWQIWANNGSNPPHKVAKGLHPTRPRGR